MPELATREKVVKFYQGIEFKAVDLPVDPANTTDTAPRLKFVASSTTTDLYGDVMSLNALQEMRDQAVGKTAFIDHNMWSLEYTLGVIETATLEARQITNPSTGAIENGTVLVITVKIAQSSLRAMAVYNLVRDGVNVGASVTIYILQSSTLEDGRNQIDSVYLLEISGVGVPAEQNSWVEQIELAVKAFQLKHGNKLLPKNPAQLINPKQKEIKAMPKSKVRRKASYRQMAKKNVFDEVLASNASATLIDLAQTLCQAVDQALQDADGGGVDDPGSAIEQLFDDFKAAGMSQIQPALDAMAQETHDDETPDAEAGAGSDDTTTSSSADDDAEAEKAYRRAKAFLRVLKFAKGKKDAEDWLDPNGDGTPDTTAPSDGSDFAQTVHDLSVGSGAMCSNDAGGTGDDMTEMGDLEGYSIPTGRGKYKEMKAFSQKLLVELKSAKLEVKKWQETIGPSLLADAETALKQPIKQ
jgi:hypothetical protein